MVNTEMFQQVFDAIAAEPERHRQVYWATRTPSCGTAFCFAGWAVHLNGDTIKWETRMGSDGGMIEEASKCVTTDGRVMGISERANEVLGIDSAWMDDLGVDPADSTTGYLYSATATLDELQEMVSLITDGAVKGPSNSEKE